MNEYVLEYIGPSGDILARDYFDSEDAVQKFAAEYLDRIALSSLNTRALYVSYPDGDEEEIWEAN